MAAFLITLLISLSTLQSLTLRQYTKHYPGRAGLASPVFTLVSGFTMAAVSFCFSGFVFRASPLTLLFGLLGAAALVLFNESMVRASQNGPYSVLMVFLIAGGILIPSLVGTIGFGDYVSPVKYAAIALILFAVTLVSGKEGEAFSDKKKFFLWSLLLGITNGVYGSVIDVQQRFTGTGEKEEALILIYGIAMLFSAIRLAVREKKDFLPAFRQNGRSLFWLIAASLVTSFAINLMAFSLSRVDLTLLYTMDNSGVFLFSVLISFLFFGEKLSKKNVVGCILMLIGLTAVTEFWVG